MTTNMMKKIDTLIGRGRVSKEDGSTIGDRQYRLTVWQQQHDDGRGGVIPGLYSVEGYIELVGHEAFGLVGESLVLDIEDGRRLPFFFTNSNGKIAARGTLK